MIDLRKTLFVFFFLLFTSNLSFSQVDQELEIGFKPYGSYHGGDLDSINLTNNYPNVHIPLIDFPERGDISYAAIIRYMNKGWSVFSNCNSQTGVCSPLWQFKGSGVQLDSDSPDDFGAAQGPLVNPSKIMVYRAGTSDGATHLMAQNQSGGVETLDGTAIWYDGTAFPDKGTARNVRGVRSFVGALEDVNGNIFSFPSGMNPNMTDTVGRSLPGASSGTTTADFSGCTGPLPIQDAKIFSFPGINGSTRQVKVCNVLVALQSNFNTSGYYNDIQYPIAERGYTRSMIQSVVLFNGTSWASSLAWTFEYDSRNPGDSSSVNYGDLTKITLPTGGTISYGWGFVSPCGSDNYNFPTPIRRGVFSRTVDANDGTGPHTWTYTNFGRVTDPDLNDTVHTFTAFNGPCSLFETKTQYFQGSWSSGRLLKTLDTQYQWVVDPFETLDPNGIPAATNVFPIHITTTWPSGQVSRVEKDYDHSLVYFDPVNGWRTGSYGNVTEERDFDYGSGAPGPLLRRKDYTYKAFDGSPLAASYLSANLVNLVASVTVYDGAGNKVAQTTSGYDESPLQTSGVDSHFHDPGLLNPGTRGNRTSESRWLNTTGGMLTTKFTYYDTGTPYQTTDPGGHTSTNFYGPGFQSGVNFLGAYVTQTQNALNQSAYFDFDFATGLRTALKDPNGQISTSDYDIFNRTLHTHAPDQGLTTWTYNDAQPPSFTVTTAITDSLNDVAEGDLDGLGRRAHTKLISDPEGIDTVDTTYDSLGRVATVSNPHRPTAAPTDGVATSIYDPLGRVTQVTMQDGSVSTTDYSQFPVVTVTDEAGHQRRTRTDALGQLVEVDEPGSPTIGAAAQGFLPVNGFLLGAVTVSITGADRSITAPDAPRPCPPSGCPKIYDSGSACINVNGGAYCAGYDQGINATAAAIAGAISSAINSGSGSAYVTARPSTASVILTSRNGTNIGSVAISFSAGSDDTADFPTGSYHGTVAAPVYDSGTVSASINGFTGAPVSYSSTVNTSAAQVATALAATLNVSGSPVTAQASGAGITINYSSLGSAGNTQISATSSSQNAATFPAGSFSGSATLAGGADPDPTGINHAFPTFYTYDGLGNLTQVNQIGDGSQPARIRSFTYDSLSRLLTAQNPESGKITYLYDNDGNLLMKTSPAPNQLGTATQSVSFCYDGLHRITAKDYQPHTFSPPACPITAPVISYTYDAGTNGVGHMTGLTDQSGTGSYSYDLMGRIAAETRVISGVSQTMSYEYNLDGSISKIHYPSSRIVNYTYDAAGRALTALDANGAQYITNSTYWPSGAQYQMWSPKIYLRTDLNKRLQIAGFYADNGKVNNFYLNKTYNYGAQNNGNVLSIVNNKDTNRTQTFNYDNLNRLISAQNTGTDCSITTVNGKTAYWGNSYGYDGWGNLLSKSITKCGAEHLQLMPNALNRADNGQAPQNGQVPSANYQYDAAGNMIWDATENVALTYDQENRITGAGGFTYTYDDDGNRVKKANGNTGTLYWYMSPGIVAESDLSGNLKSEYIFFNGKRVARVDQPGNVVHYYLSDAINSTSMVVSATGVIENESEYYPWGGELQFSNSDPANHYKFTGKERDTETGLDEMGARYYSSAIGRFTSADPLYLERRRLVDPQQLNIYAYTRNNPMRFTDPTGLDVTCNGNRCSDFLTALQKDVSFKMAISKDGKVATEGDIDQKKLSKSEKQLLKAIRDTKHHVTITAIDGGRDSSVFFGASHGANHTIAFDQAALLDAAKNAGGMTSAQLVGHETLEGYAESKGETLQDAHDFANGFFPGFDLPTGGSTGIRTATDLLSIHMLLPIHGTGVTENVEFKFNTPIPIQSINNRTAQRTPGVPVDVQVQH